MQTKLTLKIYTEFTMCHNYLSIKLLKYYLCRIYITASLRYFTNKVVKFFWTTFLLIYFS